MMQNNEIKLSCLNGIWYAEEVESGYWGKGSSANEAIDQIAQQKTAYDAFQQESGFKPLVSEKPQLIFKKIIKNIAPSLKILVIVSIAAIPLHLAIKTGIKAGGNSIKDSFEGNGVWGRIDKLILKLGDPKFELSDEDAEKLRDAMERIKSRYELLEGDQDTSVSQD